MQKWIDFLAVANFLAASPRRIEHVIGVDQSHWRHLQRYMMIVVGGVAAIAVAAATAVYFWPGEVAQTPSPAAAPAPISAVPPRVDQQTRSKQSYADGISVEADVAARSVVVTTSFKGAEIVLFGAIDDTRSSNISSKPYDVVVAIEGRDEPVVMRKKGNVAGMWINTQSARFDHVPSFYAVQSTRPLADIASSAIFQKLHIGIENILSRPTSSGTALSQADMKAYADALLRLKRASGLYIEREDGVTFTGRVLFRATVDLPPSVLVGNLVARVFLFREQELLASYTSSIQMEREGMMRYMHELAFTQQLLYGILAVVLAVAAGLGASLIFRKSGH